MVLITNSHRGVTTTINYVCLIGRSGEATAKLLRYFSIKKEYNYQEKICNNSWMIFHLATKSSRMAKGVR